MIPVEKNKEYDVIIEAVSNDGNGIARIDGFTVFVPMCAAGDKLRIKIVKVKDRYAFGRIESIISLSPTHCEAKCASYKRCGGCNIMHIKYSEQLKIKLNAVRDAVSRIGGCDGSLVSEIIGMENPYGYRNKMVFPVDIADGEIQFGFYAERSHRLIPIEKCIISDEISGRILNAVKKYMEITNTPVYNEITKKGVVRRVFIRKGFSTGEVMVVLCTATEKIRRRELLTELLKELNICSIILNVNTKPNNLVLGDKNIVLYGKDHIEDNLCGYKYKISPQSFFQVNPIQTEILYKTVVDMLDLSGSENVLDIYSGIGTISITLSKYAKNVAGIEIVKKASEDAEQNAVINGADNCRFFSGSADVIVPSLIDGGFYPDAAVIDPPRKGSDVKTLSALAKSSVKKIVYVSCNPATLARDMRYLADMGFVLQKGIAVDMFPHTCHVETVCQLVLRRSPVHINIDVDVEEMLQNKRGTATYGQIKAYVLEHSGLKVSSLNIAQVKKKCGIIERENYNKPKSENAKQPLCPPEKEKAIRDAFKHFGMIE